MWYGSAARRHSIQRGILLLVALIVGAMTAGCELPVSISDSDDSAAVPADESNRTASAGNGTSGDHQQITEDAFTTEQHAGGPPPVSIVEAGTREPRTLNPVLVGDPLSAELSRLVFSGLVNVDPETGAPEADLANHWEVSEDGTTYRFNLRDGVEWHDGQPFTAADVVFTFELMMNDRTRSPRYSRVVERVADVEALDSYSVRFQLTAPYEPFLTGIATFGIVPEHILDGVLPGELVTNPFGISSAVGTGPFQLERWDRGSRVIFQAHPDYHRRIPEFDRYEYQIMPDQQAILDGLESGSIDWARISPQEFDTAADLEGVEARSIPSYEMIAVALQLDPAQAPAFEDPAVRKALMLSLDRQEAVEDLWNGNARVAHGTIPPVSPVFQQSGVQYEYDPEQARQLLEGSGWTPGEDGVLSRDGQPLRFDLIANGDNQVRRGLAEWLAGSWREIGIDARLRYETIGNVRDLISQNRDFQALVLGYRWDIDPDQRPMWSSDSITDAFNLGGYINPEVDALLDEALVETDPAERARMYHQVQDHVMEDLPVIPLVFPDQTVAVGPRLHDVDLTAILLRNRSSVTGWVPEDHEQGPEPDD